MDQKAGADQGTLKEQAGPDRGEPGAQDADHGGNAEGRAIPESGRPQGCRADDNPNVPQQTGGVSAPPWASRRCSAPTGMDGRVRSRGGNAAPAWCGPLTDRCSRQQPADHSPWDSLR